MKDEDIYAFHPVPEPAVAPTAARRGRIWPWLLFALLLSCLLAAAGGAVALAALAGAARDGLHVTINGQPWDPSFLDMHDEVLWVLGASVALLVALMMVPLALLLGLLAAALGIGGAVLAVAAVAAVVLSPFWLVLLLLWLLLRRRRPPAATMRR